MLVYNRNGDKNEREKINFNLSFVRPSGAVCILRRTVRIIMLNLNA